MSRTLPLLLLPIAVSLMASSAPRGGQAIAAEKGDTGIYVAQDSLHRFRFSILEHAADDTCRALAVEIGPLWPDAPAEHVVLDGLPIPCPLPDGHLPAIEVIDLNFDGIRDLRLMRADRDRSIPSYRYWLFDPSQGSFVPCRQLDSIQHPDFDHARKMVGSQWYTRKGLRGTSTFHFTGMHLVLQANMEKFSEGDHERWVVWGLKDGRFQPISERIVPLTKH